ncbi:helix-turn-helix domain-containing protein [Saccharomonospora saliphila]|uniref:helix-turn-helix domain-containing protein n=1 Tax=Saccharomonospora saliphila TaxID=369829 RepID=UPI000381958B|nr:helix-turn-helix transcriptional regulator [Saccharomonospora saliphila]
MIEVSHVVAEWAFTQGLKKLREASDNSNQSEIARRIGKSRAAIGHYETGRYLPSHESLDIMLDAYGHGERAGYYRALRDRVETHAPDWWEDEFADGFPPWSLALLAGLEHSAVRIRMYDPHAVPELFRTRPYAERVLRAELPTPRAGDVADHVRMVRGRQAVLDRAAPPGLECVLDESVLRRVVGDATVHAEQLHRLRELTDEPHVDIRVLPEDRGCPAGAAGGFTTILLPRDVIQDFSEVTYVTTPVDRVHYVGTDELASFRALWDNAHSAALSADESRALLTEYAERLAART